MFTSANVVAFWGWTHGSATSITIIILLLRVQKNIINNWRSQAWKILSKQKIMMGYKNKKKRSSSSVCAWMHLLLMGIVFLAFLVGEIEGGLKSVGGKLP